MRTELDDRSSRSPTDVATDRKGPAARLGLVIGPVVAGGVLALALVAGLEGGAAAVATVGTLMAIWWMTEALPLAAVALIPVAAFPLIGAAAPVDLAGSYAHPLVFLFLGGFLIGRAIQVSGLSAWLAMAIMRRVGTSARAVLSGLMAVTAFLSMWISNTASAMIMMPIAQAMADRLTGAPETVGRTATTLLLAVAYAATVGGIATLIGTPPNALFAAFMAENYGVEIGFAEWMAVGLPISLALLPLVWIVLARRLPPTSSCSAEGFHAAATVASPWMRRVALVAGLAVAGWLSRPVLTAVYPALPLTDAGIAIAAAILLFVVPAGERGRDALLTWDEAAGIRWDVLLLFGGGLALAKGIETSGLAASIGALAEALQVVPFWAVVAILCVCVVFLGELASNTAMAALLLPIAGATAIALGAAPVEIALPLTVAASLGFMLPVATPPNAIAFGAGRFKIGEMVRPGFVLDIACIAAVVPLAMGLGRLVFG